MDDDVRRFLAERHPDAADLALWALELARRAEPDLGTRVYRGWNGIGLRHPDAGYVCGVFPVGAEVRVLFEHGARLRDPAGVLEGDGAQTRHVTVRRADPDLEPALAALVQDAIAERLFRR